MTDHDNRRSDTTDEDEAFLAAARRLRQILSHPFAIGLLAVTAAAVIFRMGITIGEAAYFAFDGDGAMAVAFGGTLAAILLAIIALGVWLDRRQRIGAADTGPLTEAQRGRLRSYLHPASPLVRWYQPVAIVVFIALATTGALLLDTPWDGLWVIAVLVANPVARWLRSRGHVLTIRDLGFPVPGLSPWPSIANAALAVTIGMGIGVLLWADALDTTATAAVTGTVVVAVVIAGGFAVNRHERHHIARLLDDEST